MPTDPSKIEPARSKLMGRYRELGLLGLGAATGVLSGVVVTTMSWVTNRLHALLFGIDAHARLSEQAALASPWLALVPALGGILIGISIAVAKRRGARPPVDPIEANALHGGRMAVGESFFLAAQTMISSGFGASVGLEAGYTQAGSSLASKLAVLLGLRRNEVRMLVGCGAAGAISAAFAAPITGAFYGFELIIGTYSVALAAPVLAAALTAGFTASWLGAVQTPIEIGVVPATTAADLVPFLALGLLGGGAAVIVMRLVALVERGFKIAKCPAPLRPVLGGLAVGALGLLSPQVLSSGHGALHLDLTAETGWQVLTVLFGLKVAASVISLGAGFRGGLFFTSLFLGSLLGKVFAIALLTTGVSSSVTPLVGAVVGMASMAVGIVGGPMTMTFLVLETTRDLTIAGAVLAASIMSAVVVRESFGYSFSTWRLHLRGETIRSAHDVGWMRNLTVGSMMRSDVKTVVVDTPIEAFRIAYPLGSTQRVIAVDGEGLYAGIVIVADAHALLVGRSGAVGATIADLVTHQDVVLLATMNAKEAAGLFRLAASEELAVVETPTTRRVVGLLTEQHLLRRYAEELDKAQRNLSGES